MKLADALDRTVLMIITAGPPFCRSTTLELTQQVATGALAVSWAADLADGPDVAMITVRPALRRRMRDPS